MMRRTVLLLATVGVPVATLAADGVYQFQLSPDPGNMSACIAMAPQLERGQTVTVSGNGAEIAAGGGLKSRMESVRPDVWRVVIELAGQRVEYVAELGAARTLSARGNNLGCKWTGKAL
jgi:hypothetical protein